MTIDKAIKYCHEKAEELKESITIVLDNVEGELKFHDPEDIINSSDLEQMAEWLTDYKRLLENEKPTGEWENITPSNHLTPGGSPILRCPFCKDRESVHLGGVEGHHWVFCPICGSKMVKNKEEIDTL